MQWWVNVMKEGAVWRVFFMIRTDGEMAPNSSLSCGNVRWQNLHCNIDELLERVMWWMLCPKTKVVSYWLIFVVRRGACLYFPIVVSNRICLNLTTTILIFKKIYIKSSWSLKLGILRNVYAMNTKERSICFCFSKETKNMVIIYPFLSVFSRDSQRRQMY